MMIKCNCDACGTEIFRNKDHFERNKSKRFACSKQCQNIIQDKKITCNCTECGKEFKKQRKDLNESGNNFCSRSCSGKFNNRSKKKPYEEKLNARKKNNCTSCGKKIYYRSAHCDSCKKQSMGYVLKKTISEHSYKKGSERYVKIRDNARVVYRKSGRPKCCKNCNYSKHIEICHIKSIKEFPKESLVSEVNDLSNLIALCRNCHWELDHGLLNQSINSENKIHPFLFCF